MALVHKASAGSDDEDLECLRMAALQSLKRTAAPAPAQTNSQARQPNSQRTATFGSAQPTRHHGRSFRGGGNRAGRNGMFARNFNRFQSTNLISIRTVDSEDSASRDQKTDEMPKLILPQDRYHKAEDPQSDGKESSNKFNRYDDNSEESDSDSDSESKRDREDSLERLMDELEDKIHERTEKPTPKKPKKEVSEKSKEDKSDKDSDNKDTEVNEGDSVLIIECGNDLVQEELLEEEEEEKPQPEKAFEAVKVAEKRKSPSRSSPGKTFSHRRKSRSRSPKRPRYESRPLRRESPPRKMPYPEHYQRPISPLTLNADVLSSMTRAPLSPRSAAFVLQNREILARRKMSPRKSLSPRHSLSPRRQAVSPRRRSRSPWFDFSHKRSLSPRCRSPRSFSPRRRSTSPRNRPRRTSKEERHLVAPVRRNSRSPLPKTSVHKRLGIQRISPQREKKLEPVPVKRSNRSMSLSLSPSPDRNYNRHPLNDTTGIVKADSRRNRDRGRKETPEKKVEKETIDPVLEARRRKFQNPVQLDGNGIIKLKVNKKEEKMEEDDDEKILDEEHISLGELMDESEENVPEENHVQEEHFEEDEEEEAEMNDLQDDDEDLLDLNPTVDDLWSDEEESDDENESRFKTSNKSEKRTVSYLPFSKLTEKPVPARNNLSNTKDNDRHNNRRDDRRRNSIRNRSPNRSRSRKDLKPRERPRELSKPRESVKTKDPVKPKDPPKPSVKPKEITKPKDIKEKSDKHLDIKSKIRMTETNSVKVSESKNKKEVRVKENVEKEESKPVAEEVKERRVKVHKLEGVEPLSPEEDDTEIIIENDDDEDEAEAEVKDDGGDLRAELSRRRAQRLYKAGSLSEVLPARLLKSALKEVGMKRSSKHPKVEKSAVASSVDRRVLVLKRLADSPEPELENTHKELKKEGKLPIHMRLGLTSSPDRSLEEVVRAERRKRPRTGRRKRVVQV